MRGSTTEPGVIPLAVQDLFDIIQEVVVFTTGTFLLLITFWFPFYVLFVMISLSQLCNKLIMYRSFQIIIGGDDK